ncbi:hypothetical protein [Vibrio crassostreae]|uniref:hypothetical protein n=1 Tax=Vibrio crassostreae TaxID=246167 RepID=UPI001B30DA62|nr:hypothetical protein [Vibrio crassostreae]
MKKILENPKVKILLERLDTPPVIMFLMFVVGAAMLLPALIRSEEQFKKQEEHHQRMLEMSERYSSTMLKEDHDYIFKMVLPRQR